MKQNTKRVVASILTAMMTLGAFGIAGCKDKEQGAVLPTTQTQDSTQSGGSRPMVNNEVYGEPYAGTVVRCGQSYDFTGGSIGFLAEELTGLSDGETYTVELVATVEPADAVQEVRWAVAFVNPESEWATGKDVSDYVSIEYSEEESTKLSVTCKKGFSEQVKITCTYLHNADISVDCIVDFVSAWENVTLKMGDDIINLGGVTDVWWETNENADAGVAWGGDISLDIKTAEEGTVTGYTYRVDLLSPLAWYEEDETIVFGGTKDFLDGYFTALEKTYKFTSYGELKDDAPTEKVIDYSIFGNSANLSNIESFLLGADSKKAMGLFVSGTTSTSGELDDFLRTEPSFLDKSTKELVEGSLCTVLLTVTSASGTQIKYMSLLNLTEFRYTPAATAVSLSSSKIKVSYEP